MKFELEPDNRGFPDAALLDDLRNVARKLGKDYVTKDEYNEHGRWCAATFQKRFGSWCKGHELAGLRKVRNFEATVEDCVADIQRVAKELGKTTLTMSEYKRYGTFSEALIPRRCGSWVAAIEQARLTVSPLYRKRATDEQLFESLEHLWEALGRQPRRPDFVKPLSRYSYDAYRRRFGCFRKALEAFVASVEGHEPEEPEEPTKDANVGFLPIAASKRHRTSRTVSWRMRFLVTRRDGYKCCICGACPAIKPGTVFEIDHIVPWDDGGETVMENLQTLCKPCNGGKSNLPMFAE
jgi:hypothetical protein